MDKSLAWRIPVILVVVGLGALIAATRPVRRGIDIDGGVSLLYEINKDEVPAESRTGLTERTTDVVRKRLDPEGVRELTIRAMGQYRFEVQMPKPAGADDQDVNALVEEAKRKVGRVGRLEFRLLADEKIEREARATGKWPSGCKWYPVARESREKLDKRDKVLVRIDDGFDLTGSYLAGVGRGFDKNNRPAVSFSFNARGAKRFGRLTSQNINKRLAIILDGQVQSAPVIKSRIDKAGIIEGGTKGFGKAEQDELVAVLNAGSLDASLTLLSEKVVGGQMGEENIQKAIRAIVWAGILVLSFMAVYYLAAGLVADFALAFNLVLVLAVMSLLSATLTLPGMAGLVLTIGMAVDANVLIFERIREEKRTHLALPLAITNGYDRAFRTILDANVTTIIAAGTLFLFGSEAIKGFGITLTLGLLCSMFTALFVTRTIFTGLTGGGVIKRLPMLRLVRDTRIDFLRFRRLAWGISLALVVLGAVLFLRRPLSESLGMDFTGGTAIGFRLKQPMEVAEVKRRLADAGYPKANVQTERRPGEEATPLGVGRSFLVTVRDPDRDAVRNRILEALKDELPTRAVTFEFVRTEPMPEATEDDTGDAKVFAGGLRCTVKLTPAITRLDLDKRVRDALAWAESKDEPFGQHTVAVTRSLPEGTIEQFDLYSKETDPGVVDTLLTRAFRTSPFHEVTSFGSKVASGMKRDALVAMAVALVLILIYIRVRFGRWLYGLGAIVALVHDVLVTLAVVSLGYVLAPTVIGRALMLEDFKISLVLIAAFLTIIGYSINDTIVVFDRVRENLGGRKDRRVTPEIINQSLNQVLSRTVLTSMTTLVVVLTLYLFGGTAVHGFAFAMMIGVIVGTYSSIYIAPPFLLGWALPEKAVAEAEPAGKAKAAGKTASSKKRDGRNRRK